MRKSYAGLIIGTAISLVAIYLIATQVDHRQVWEILKRTNLALLSLALVSIMVNNAAKAWRWKVLLGHYGQHVSFWSLLHLHLLGQLLNQFLPARAGELSRLYFGGLLGMSRGVILGTMVLEKTIDLTYFALLGSILFFLMPLPLWINQSSFVLALIMVLIPVSLFVVIRTRRHALKLFQRFICFLPTQMRNWATQFLNKILEILDMFSDHKFTIRIILYSTVIWMTAVLNNTLILLALGIEAPPVVSIFVLFVLLAGINIVSAPGQIGIFQYLCILSLGVFGVDQISAFSFSIVLYLLIMLPMVSAGIVAFRGFGLKRPDVPIFDSEKMC